MLRRSFRFQSELAAVLDAILVCGTLLAALITHKVLAWLFPGTFAIFDMFWSNSLFPPLSAVRQPAGEIGIRAAELLIQRINDPKRSCIQMILNPELMIRKSC